MSKVLGASRPAGGPAAGAAAAAAPADCPAMDVAGPMSSLVPASTLFFSLLVDSVSDPIPFREMVFPLELTVVCFCCLQPKLSLIGVERLGSIENQKASGML